MDVLTTGCEGDLLIRNRAILVLLSAFLACGEFHTEKYYRDVAKADVFDPSVCEVLYEAELAGDELVALRQHGPAAITVYEMRLPQGMELVFSLTGNLPVGLKLSETAGTISGFPETAGTYDIELRAAVVKPLEEGEFEATEDPCVRPSLHKMTLEVLPGCETDDDCPADFGFSGTCQAPGRCVWSNPLASCPDDPGAAVQFDLAAAPASLMEESFELVSHHQLTEEEQALPGLAGFSHQLLLGAGETLLWALPYRLVDHWPLPYYPGDQVRVVHNSLAPSRLTLVTPSGEPASLLYNGPLPEDGTTGVAEGDVDITVKRVHLDCLVEDDSQLCGPQAQDLLLFTSTSDSPPPPLGSGEQADWSAGGKAYTLAVASAFTHLPDQFDCGGVVKPTTASFQAFPLATCPIARIWVPSESPVALRPGDDLMRVNLEGGDSLAHLGGDIVDYQWTLDRQPFPGLVGLSYFPAANGASKALWALLPVTAAGTYNILLHVTDQDDRRSCVAALSQVRVLAASEIDLRVELVWWTDKDELAVDADLDLLLMHPINASALGEAVWQSEAWEGSSGTKWICSEKNPSPANWAALPEEEGTLCRVAPGNLGEGLPEVATVARLDRDKKTNRYPVAVRASTGNPGIVFAGIRIFVEGVPKYETTRHPLLPGQVWQAGHVDVEFMKFVPHKNGK